MGIPYCIVKGKARLGRLVYRNTCTCVALTSVSKFCKLFLKNVQVFILYDDHLYRNMTFLIIQHALPSEEIILIISNSIRSLRLLLKVAAMIFVYRLRAQIAANSPRSWKPSRQTSMNATMKFVVTGEVVFSVQRVQLASPKSRKRR